MSAVLDELMRCEPIKQAQIDKLRAAGVDVVAMAMATDGSGIGLSRDHVVIDVDRRRFEFGRHSRLDILAVPAIILLALDRDGEPLDLVCWRDRMLASWLGKAEILGLEQLCLARMDEPFPIFVDVLDWLRNGRYGAVPIDMKRAGPVLRDEGRLIVDNIATRVELLGSMRVQMPEITVRSTKVMVAAE